MNTISYFRYPCIVLLEGKVLWLARLKTMKEPIISTTNGDAEAQDSGHFFN